MSDVTKIRNQIKQGDADASAAPLPLFTINFENWRPFGWPKRNLKDSAGTALIQPPLRDLRRKNSFAPWESGARRLLIMSVPFKPGPAFDSGRITQGSSFRYCRSSSNNDKSPARTCFIFSSKNMYGFIDFGI